MLIKTMLVLNKDHKPVGMKKITITRDFMYYRKDDCLVLVAPANKGGV